MSPELQRVKIAESCGWRHIERPKFTDGMEYMRSVGIIPLTRQFWHEEQLPDFLNDLNTIHEAENHIDPCDWGSYTMALRQIIQRDCDRPECYVIEAERAQLIADFWFYHATAAQRAEAFLRVLNLWEDEAV